MEFLWFFALNLGNTAPLIHLVMSSKNLPAQLNLKRWGKQEQPPFEVKFAKHP